MPRQEYVVAKPKAPTAQQRLTTSSSGQSRTNPNLTAAPTPSTGGGRREYVTKPAAKPKDEGDGHGGIVGNLQGVGKMIAGAPSGVAGFLKQVGHDAVYAPLKDIAENVAHPRSFGRYRGPETTIENTTAESFQRTGHAVTHPGEYAKAYREGQLGARIAEDLANISIVGSVAGGALRSGLTSGVAGEAVAAFSPRVAAARAGAEGVAPRIYGGGVTGLSATAEEAAARATTATRAGSVLQGVGRLGAQGGNLPAKPYEWAAKGLRAGAEASGVAPFIRATEVGQNLARVGERVGARRTVAQHFGDEFVQPAAQVSHDLTAEGPAVTKHLTPDENRAVNLTLEGRLQAPSVRAALREVADLGGEDQVRQFFTDVNGPVEAGDLAHEITPAAAKLASDYFEGALSPKKLEQFEAARDFLSTNAKRFEEEVAVPGFGRTRALNPEQLGSELLTSETTQHPRVVKARERVAAASTEYDAVKAEMAAANPADAAEIAGRGAQVQRTLAGATKELGKTERQVWSRLEAAPARYRPALQTARAADGAIADLQAQLRSQGADHAVDALQTIRDELPTTLAKLVDQGIDPVHLLGGQDPYARGARRSGAPSQRQYDLTRRKLGSERQRVELKAPQTIQGRTARVVEDYTQAIRNNASETFGEKHRVTPADVGVRGLRGAKLNAAMAEHDLVAWDARMPNHTPSPNQVTEKTVFIPKSLKAAADSYLAPDGPIEQFMQATFDKERKLWKDLTLPLSGSWHVGNIVSNALMNTGGTGSVAWASKLPTAWKAVRAEGHGVTDVPARLFGTTLDHELDSWIKQRTGKNPGRVRRTLDASYRLNQFVDNLSRVSIYLAEHERLTGEGAAAGVADKQALRTSLKVAGDFSNLTKFEQQWVRRAVPFYSWLRHTTQLTKYMAVENPSRLIWTMQLANLYNADAEGTFADAITTGRGYISIGNLNPLGQFSSTFLEDPGSLGGVLRSVGPEWSTLAAATTGLNLDRGGAPLRLPPGMASRDEFGADQLTPLITRPGALVHYAERQVPLFRSLQDINRGRTYSTYDEGSPLLYKGKLRDSTPFIPGTDVSGRLALLAKQAGVPIERPFSPPGQIAKTAKERAATAEKARLKYQRDAARALGR